MKEISQVLILKRVISENIWWDGSESMPSMYQGYLPRPYLEIFYPVVTKRDVQRAAVLMGPRRIGKTVLLHHVIQKLIKSGIDPKKICYVSVDNPLYNGMDLESFMSV